MIYIIIYTLILYSQTTINKLLLIDRIIEKHSVYNIAYPTLFSLSYCAIITKVKYNYCNILFYILLLIFHYTYHFLDINKYIFNSVVYIFDKLTLINVLSEVITQSNYKIVFRNTILFGSFYNILLNFQDILIHKLKEINNFNYIHSGIIILIIILNLVNKNKHNILKDKYFDLASRRFLLISGYGIIHLILDIFNMTDIDFIISIISYVLFQKLIVICSIKNLTKLYIVYTPFLIFILNRFVSSIYISNLNNNIIYITIVGLTTINQQLNSRLYCFVCMFIILPTIIENLYYYHKNIEYLSILLYPILNHIHNIYLNDIEFEKNNIEENSIKNNVDIIINE